MKKKFKQFGRVLAGLTAFGVLVGSLTFLNVGEDAGSVTVMAPDAQYMDGGTDMSAMMQMMDGSGDMSAMMEQYQQYMNGGSMADMSAMAGSSGDMTALLEQYMGGSIDGDMAELISKYMGGDISSLLGGETEEEPIEWVTVEIRDHDDWEEFVRNCRMDTWSKDKKVQLKTDLTLEENEIVPTFGGVFDGEGHTIDGLILEEDGSYRGLFRYIQAGAEVKDLNVEGTVTVTGGWEAVGGIAGENRGTIARCTFDGRVEGPTNVGGIAGVNETTGQIVGCSVSGEISGDHGTGGITGKNNGSLIRCISTADVNTGVESVTPELDDVKIEDIASSENFAACTDTGGIAGYSAGFIQHCISRGDIGYPHTGYNVGGIVGRQSGYIVNCTNHGSVWGRKEVGGIVGQMEPFVQPNLEQNSLLEVTTVLGDLQSQLDSILAGLGGSNHELSGHMTNLSELTIDAQGSIDGILGSVTDLGTGMIDTVNDLSARLARVIEMAVPMIEDVEDTFGSISDMIDLLEEAIAELEEAADPLEEMTDELYDAMGDISDGADDVETAVSALETALETLLEAIGTADETDAALTQVEIALQVLGQSLKATAEAVGVLADVFVEMQEGDLSDGLNWDTSGMAEELEAVEAAINKNQEAAWLFVEGLKALERAIFAESDQDIADLGTVWDKFGDGFRAFASSGGEMHDAFDHIRDMIPPMQDVGDEVLDSSEIFRGSMDSLADASDYIADAMGELAKIFEDQAQYPALQLPNLDDNFRKDSENLSTTVTAMLAEMQALQLSVSDMVDDLIAGLRELVGSFDDLAASLMSSLMGGSSELVEDVSEDESGGVFGVSLGTVSGCTNLGAVDGDTNVGGITGSMAVEFSIDPDLEVDLTSMPMVSVTFQTRAVLKDSVNRGAVTARKDCAGGVVGRAGLGLVKSCTAVSDVTGSGNYVGGIVGLAETPVRSSWAKGLLSGAAYVGGVAGSATELTDCRAQAQLKETAPYSGAVAGEAKTLSGNYFVGDEGGVDGISYAGKAEPIDMDGFLALEDVPEALRTMTVTFVYEDGTVDVVSVEPGGRLDDKDVPELPAKEGYSALWDGLEDLGPVEFDTVIQAVYTPKSSTVQSSQLRDDGRPVLLVQSDLDTAEVELTESTAVPQLEEGETFVEGWSFEIPRGRSETTVRYLLPNGYSGGKLRLLVRNDNEWTEADYTVDGSYAVLTVKPGANELACIHTPGIVWPWIAAGCGGAVIVILIAVILLKRKRHP